MVDSQLDSINWLSIQLLARCNISINSKLISYQNFHPALFSREPGTPTLSLPSCNTTFLGIQRHGITGSIVVPVIVTGAIIRNYARRIIIWETHCWRCGLVEGWAMQVQVPFQHWCPTTFDKALQCSSSWLLPRTTMSAITLLTGRTQKIPDRYQTVHVNVLPRPQHPFSKFWKWSDALQKSCMSDTVLLSVLRYYSWKWWGSKAALWNIHFQRHLHTVVDEFGNQRNECPSRQESGQSRPLCFRFCEQVFGCRTNVMDGWLGWSLTSHNSRNTWPICTSVRVLLFSPGRPIRYYLNLSCCVF